jgi:DNA-binding NtrC family response regulator
MSDGNELVCVPQASAAISAAAPPAGSYAAAKAAVLADFERRFVRDLLTRSSGNVTRAAAEAGKDRRAFGRLVKKHGLRTSDFRP